MAAGLGFKTFTTGEVLTAADTNGYLMQGVLVFASSAARAAAITSPQEGQYSYLKDTNSTEYYDGAAWIAAPIGDITGVTAGVGISGGGTSGTVTVTNSMATEITAAGDIIVGTGSGTFDNLPIGTTAQVLTADTTVSPYKVKWATPASGGGMTLLSTTTLSGTSVNIGVASGYINLFVVIYGVTTNNNYELQFRINSIAGVPYYMNAQRSFSATTVPDPADTFFVFNPGGVAALNSSANNTYTALIENYASGSMYKTVTTNAGLTDNVSVKSQVNMQGVIFDNTAMTSITIGTTTGTPTFSAGTVLIYGVK